MNQQEAIEYLQSIADNTSLTKYSEALNIVIDALYECVNRAGCVRFVPISLEEQTPTWHVDTSVYSVKKGEFSPAKIVRWRPLQEPPKKA